MSNSTPPPAPSASASYGDNTEAPSKKRGGCFKILLIGFVGFVLLLVIGAVALSMGEGEDAASPTSPATSESSEEEESSSPDESEAAQDEDTDGSEADEQEPSEEASDPGEDSGLTSAQDNALRAARNYLEFSGFSRQGLIDQLSSEYGDQYAVEDATAAVDYLEQEVSWGEQAERSARQYLDVGPFSRQGLINQLSSEYGDQYTVEQATAGVDAVEPDVDWNEEAAEAAQNYLEISPFSRDQLIEQLSSEYGDQFTVEQATYGVDQTDL